METLEKTPMSQVAEIQITYKPVIKPSQRPKIDCSKDVYELLSNNWDLNKIEFVEQFKIILLNRANRVLGILDISTGGFAGTVADPKVIFGAALKAAASSIILAHNHPSGNLKPSQADIALTHKITTAGTFLDIAVLEHIILTSESYLSFADEGLM
ncbi:MAG TPA: JAB domain-containing protein [Daejeonella sp.]